MTKHFRRPELIPTLAMLVTVITMFSLGVWQLYRLQWKTELLARIEQAQSQPPQDLLAIPTSDLAQKEWYNVKVTGHFLYDKELYATPRYLHEHMGYAILTPLAVSTPHGTRFVLINRGWVAPERKDPATRLAGNADAEVTVEGAIRTHFRAGAFTPDNHPEKNLWFWYDLPAMAQATHLELLPVLIDAARITANGTVVKEAPEPFPIEITIRNDHLGYAITWFLLGIIALVMYGIYYREPKQEAIT